jgi:hypothetical protein
VRRSLRPWWLALGVSVLLHALLLGGPHWTLPRWEPPPEPQPFEARLVSVAPPAAQPPPAAPVHTPAIVKPPPPHHPARKPEPSPPKPAVEPAAAAPEAPAAADGAESAVPAGGTVIVKSAPAAEPAHEPAPVEIITPPLNALPPRIELHFELHYGLASGEQTLLWVNEGDKHYTLISVARATGLTGLFYRGQFVQTSRGRITPRGLQPEEFWDQRGNKRSSAQFNAAQGLLTLIPAQGTPRHFNYQGTIQDVVSLLFQVALTAPPASRQMTYTVFNGKKLRSYTYEVLGEAEVETELGRLRTLHLARVGDDSDRFEIWLAIDRHYLPVRVLSSDDGSEMEMRLKSIAP